MSKERLTEEQLEQLQAEAEAKIGLFSTWRHVEQDVYVTVTGIGLKEDEPTQVMVAYKHVKSPIVWYRPIESFVERYAGFSRPPA